MQTPDYKGSVDFEKALKGLWRSLQKHLTELYEAEKLFTKGVTVSESFPFNPDLVDADKLLEYWKQRNNLRDLFIDETEQLGTLINAIRQKGYREEDKKQLLLLILGYMDIADSIFEQLETYKPLKHLDKEDYSNAQNNFGRLKKFIRLNIKGIMPTF